MSKALTEKGLDTESSESRCTVRTDDGHIETDHSRAEMPKQQ